MGNRYIGVLLRLKLKKNREHRVIDAHTAYDVTGGKRPAIMQCDSARWQKKNINKKIIIKTVITGAYTVGFISHCFTCSIAVGKCDLLGKKSRPLWVRYTYTKNSPLMIFNYFFAQFFSTRSFWSKPYTKDAGSHVTYFFTANKKKSQELKNYWILMTKIVIFI